MASEYLYIGSMTYEGKTQTLVGVTPIKPSKLIRSRRLADKHSIYKLIAYISLPANSGIKYFIQEVLDSRRIRQDRYDAPVSDIVSAINGYLYGDLSGSPTKLVANATFKGGLKNIIWSLFKLGSFAATLVWISFYSITMGIIIGFIAYFIYGKVNQ